MEIENIHIHSECMPALVELIQSCGYKGVIHKGEQWIKFYKGKEYIGAMKVHQMKNLSKILICLSNLSVL